jgi:NIMA (never in mitosis gene a)-related kinase
MLKVNPKERPNVEDLLNLPYVSMRLREKALRNNIQHMRKKVEEMERKRAEAARLEKLIADKEKELSERERQVEEHERALAEMQRKKYSSGSSTTNPGTDLGNDSCIKHHQVRRV